MSPLTIQLPETLHQNLINLAEGEGVSLDQYVVYALTRQVTLTYSITRVSEAEIIQQKESFNALLEELKPMSFDDIQSILADREKVEPEPELTPEIINAVQQMIREKIKP